MVCPSCRKRLPNGTASCPHCGRKLRNATARKSGKKNKKRDAVTPLLIGMLAVNLVISAGIITIITSKPDITDSQPAAEIHADDIAEQTVPATSAAETESSVPVPSPSELQVHPDQPETIDQYLLAPKLRFGMDRQTVMDAVQTMNPLTEARISGTDAAVSCTYYFDKGTISHGQYAQTDIPVRMTLYFRNDKLYQYALVFGQNQNNSVTASAIDAGSMFTRLFDVCSVLFAEKPTRTDNATGENSAANTANVVFTCSGKRMALLGIVEYPGQDQMNYCYLQYGSLEN